jgi:hypothetical protein
MLLLIAIDFILKRKIRPNLNTLSTPYFAGTAMQQNVMYIFLMYRQRRGNATQRQVTPGNQIFEQASDSLEAGISTSCLLQPQSNSFLEKANNLATRFH